jgi:hypothetical protein
LATKIAMARELIAAALDAGAPSRWVLADALYGGDYRLRNMLEERGRPNVLAIRSNQIVRLGEPEGFVETDAATVAEEWQPEKWTMLSADEGSKGLRLYEWARLALQRDSDTAHERWLLIRRNRKEPNARAYYLVFAPWARLWLNSPAPPACAGQSRNALSAPKAISGSTIAKRVPGTVGIVT